VHARIPMVMPEEANADLAAYWGTYSAMFADEGASYREDAARALKQAEEAENAAAIFADNRAAALRGERTIDPMVVGELLAAPCAKGDDIPDGTPIIMANGEPGIHCTVKRPFRNDRRRRRSGVRFTPKPVKGWTPGFGSRRATPEEIEEIAAAARAAEETDTE
jgi:hypothetical protein